MSNGVGRQRVMLKRIPMVGVFISLAGGVVAGRYLYFTLGLLGVVMALGLVCAAVTLRQMILLFPAILNGMILSLLNLLVCVLVFLGIFLLTRRIKLDNIIQPNVDASS